MNGTLKRWHVRLIVRLTTFLCLALLSHATAAGQTINIAETLQRLQRIKTDESSADVPPAAKPLLVQLKHQLRDLILETLNEETGRSAHGKTLRARVLAKLKMMGIKVGAPRMDADYQYLYGDILDIEAQRPARHTDLLAVTTTVSIRCGEDSSLYLFQRQRAGWRLLLADEANNYKEITGAQGLFGYAVAPPDRRGHFYVVTVSVNPWCVSNWQRIRYKVMRPGTSAEQPEIIISREEGIYLGVEPRYALNAKAGGFTLTFTGAQHLDAGILTRLYIENFRIDENRATRIAPVAARPEDFLDEWLQLPWSEAARWTATPARSELKRWHERLRKSDGAYFSEISFVQPRHNRKREWQIATVLEGRDSASALPSKLFFTVVRRHHTFFLRHIGTEDDEEKMIDSR